MTGCKPAFILPVPPLQGGKAAEWLTAEWWLPNLVTKTAGPAGGGVWGLNREETSSFNKCPGWAWQLL